jgi:hypothetical protein
MRAAIVALALSLLVLVWQAPIVRADDQVPELGAPYAPLVRQHYYERLA